MRWFSFAFVRFLLYPFSIHLSFDFIYLFAISSHQYCILLFRLSLEYYSYFRSVIRFFLFTFFLIWLQWLLLLLVYIGKTFDCLWFYFSYCEFVFVWVAPVCIALYFASTSFFRRKFYIRRKITVNICRFVTKTNKTTWYCICELLFSFISCFYCLSRIDFFRTINQMDYEYQCS